ncbi:acyl carrier protein [Streptomyces sp. JJ38]|uniref:acyl carrier protein n=1 Tax=Streptomyces sp. JJ38 TaxID=2738128 RepID=UPI001C55F9EF|nr:acyl carrier protein [Streptomyces sp. JJ38]MBW1599703.1 acyl carrier protein [Streptomyces sp. JJ38]
MHTAAGPQSGERSGPADSAPPLQDWLVRRIARQLGVGPEAVDVDAPVADLNLDSLDARQIAHDLERECGSELTLEALRHCDTLRALAAYLESERHHPRTPAWLLV